MDIKAQIAKWLIPPMYDRIQLVNGIDAVLTDSAGVKNVWTLDGQRLISCKDEILSFKEGIALAVKPGTSMITMAYKQNGESINIENCSVTHGYPYYSNGKLLVLQGAYYRYIDTDGNFSEGKYTNAYPYSNGYAVCETYLNLEKQKDAYCLLLDDKGRTISLSYQGKTFDIDDLQFISSVNDENIGIVVAKQRVYFFNGASKKLSPVSLKDDLVQNVKEQAKLISSIDQCFLQDSDSTYVLTAKCGKNDRVSICFDLMRRPISIKRNEEEYFYKRNEEAKRTLETHLRIRKEGGYIGLYWDNIGEMLPSQFDEVMACFDDKALVKINGKVGMLQVFKDESFKIRMNKGNDIAFRHQKFETSIRVDFPTFLQANKVNIEIDPQTGCDIDKTSKNYKNTESGNFVEYNCVLNIPENLPDELTAIEYPIVVQYNGIRSSRISFKVNAWHYKYFVVDVDDSQTALENGTVSFVFNINAERIASDGTYPTTVNILTDSLQYEYEKMSEIRHKCKVYSLKEGVNNIVVQVLEQGCPPAAFPFEVEYYKPVAKTRNKPAEKEKVTIKKKEKASPVKKNEDTDRPRVIM